MPREYQEPVELRHLRYFVAVAEASSLRSAAERLRVAQPALSRQIRDLEGAVGVRLFERSSRGMSLTDGGVVFLDEARDLLERVEMAVSAAREAEAGRLGRISIGNFGPLSTGFLPAALSAFRIRCPHVEVNLVELPLPDQIEALQRGTVQLAFTVDSGAKLPPELETTEVLVSHVAVAMGKGHRLAREPIVSLRELTTEQILCVAKGARHDLHQRRIEAIFAARGVKHRPVRRVTGFESLMALIAGDHGVSLIMPVVSATSTGDVVSCRIAEDGEDLVVRLYAVWRRGGTSKLVENFVDVLRGLAKRLR
jgi:DNA-binding transcriptional LysR family regulator